ncbi:MAG: rRNA maturation RNase YbeY [Pseudotabrizicola sp.]|uniref:rRNA maturation RNase YbeY n=1 Tax=Pseudotabrizicola sp. TaxID=2939647 RepID=UPI00271AE661|nr:rRNA maturation RNase YbeY [Pseudotabrizicola sp.]MDO8881976.1 rRNA maturation RNase YbeY [Pseudotabrizicola sp.]MDP2080699.1 rRNA maturation RNase YbeY [Pseudotabrizicola sp.]MDZ7574715.1 rRNA maturation RNase YbeY [Pseudotabrizicola sp.]
MEPLVDCVIEDDRWERLGLESLSLRAASAVLAGLGMPEPGFTLCVMGCDDARISVLNAEFRGKPLPTNVLSWPSEDLAEDGPGADPARPLAGEAAEPWSLGDIAISYDTCAREAKAAGKPLADHVLHLVVHGVLHLLGYDHVDDADAALMEKHEVAILATLGVDDPY